MAEILFIEVETPLIKDPIQGLRYIYIYCGIFKYIKHIEMIVISFQCHKWTCWKKYVLAFKITKFTMAIL